MKRLLPRIGFLLVAVYSFGLTAPCRAEEEEAWQVPVMMEKDGWMVFENVRFGSVIPVPVGMVPLRPPDNSDGQRFASQDGKVELAVWGSFNIDDFGNVDTRWKSALAEEDRTITYKRKAAGWFVVSGVKNDGTAFYERYEANKKYCCGWILSYPQAEEKKYSGWVERIAKGFEARLGKGVDH